MDFMANWAGATSAKVSKNTHTGGGGGSGGGDSAVGGQTKLCDPGDVWCGGVGYVYGIRSRCRQTPPKLTNINVTWRKDRLTNKVPG